MFNFTCMHICLGSHLQSPPFTPNHPHSSPFQIVFRIHLISLSSHILAFVMLMLMLNVNGYCENTLRSRQTDLTLLSVRPLIDANSLYVSKSCISETVALIIICDITLERVLLACVKAHLFYTHIHTSHCDSCASCFVFN